MRLHIVTAITRPANLGDIAASLAAACVVARIDLVWHWRFDLDREHVGGQKLKNDALDAITDGWVWMLDDDTIAHSETLQAFVAHTAAPSVSAVVFGQWRADGRVLVASAEHARVGFIDIGQAFLRRDAIGQHRLPEHYDGDGMFLEQVLPACNVVYDNQHISYHNALVLDPIGRI